MHVSLHIGADGFYWNIYISEIIFCVVEFNSYETSKGDKSEIIGMIRSSEDSGDQEKNKMTVTTQKCNVIAPRILKMHESCMLHLRT